MNIHKSEILSGEEMVSVEIKQECDVFEPNHLDVEVAEMKVFETKPDTHFLNEKLLDVKEEVSTSAIEFKGPYTIANSSERRSAFLCHYCQRRFKTKGAIEQHILLLHINNSSFKCASCNASFATKSYVRKHVQLHIIGRDFPCQLCGLRFKRKWNLDKHLIIHDPNISFPCQSCSRKYKRKSELRNHIEKGLCRKEVNNDGCIRLDHGRNSSTAEPRAVFHCNVCQRSFTMKQNLARHMSNTHNNETTLFACELCDKKYRRKSDLKCHVDNVHSELQHDVLCGLCNKKFAHSRLLKRHVRRHEIQGETMKMLRY